MVRLLPYREIALSSPLKPEEALGRLAAAIRPLKRGIFRFRLATDGKFHGSVSGNHFEITRDIGYRNGFLPFIRGTILPSGDGSLVNVQMEMHRAANCFMMFWLGCVASACIVFSLTLVEHSFQGDSKAELIPFVMLAFSFCMMTIGFYPETGIAKKFICDTLHAVENNPRIA